MPDSFKLPSKARLSISYAILKPVGGRGELRKAGKSTWLHGYLLSQMTKSHTGQQVNVELYKSLL